MSAEQASILDRLSLVLGTGLGAGKFPWAPGTVGTLWGLPLAWAIAHLPHIGWQIGAIAVLCLVGVPICDSAARQLGVKDPGSVVWDELAAMPIVFLGLSPDTVRRPEILLIGFVLFRIFDISKLPPTKQCESLPGGWGIMADDIAAALYSLLVLTVLRSTIPWLGNVG